MALWQGNSYPGPDGSTAPLFDAAKLCSLLGLEGSVLPFSDCEFCDTSLKFRHQGADCVWRFADDSIIRLPAPLPEETPSPDEESALFLRGHDLWLRRRASGEEVRLTWDGVEDCDYGRLVDYDASITMERTGYVQHPLAVWSPDSRKFLTFKIDMRPVKKLYAIEAFDDPHSESIRPRLHSYRCPFPEDSDRELPIVTLWLGDAVNGTLRQLDCEPYCFPLLLGNTSSSYARWLEDSSAVYFTWFSRGNKKARLCLCDAETGEVRTLVEESHEKSSMWAPAALWMDSETTGSPILSPGTGSGASGSRNGMVWPGCTGTIMPMAAVKAPSPPMGSSCSSWWQWTRSGSRSTSWQTTCPNTPTPTIMGSAV